MEIFNAIAPVGFAMLILLAAYLVHRVIDGIDVYYRFRGTRFVTCPETHKAAIVEVAAKCMGIHAILDDPCFRMSNCSRWPMREGCGQDCLIRIATRPSELKFSDAWRPS